MPTAPSIGRPTPTPSWARKPPPSPRAREILLEVARGGRGHELQRIALRHLGAVDPLAALYRGEADVEVRRAVLHAFGIQENVPRLIEIARHEDNHELRREAVRWLGMSGSEEAVAFLVELLEE